MRRIGVGVLILMLIFSTTACKDASGGSSSSGNDVTNILSEGSNIKNNEETQDIEDILGIDKETQSDNTTNTDIENKGDNSDKTQILAGDLLSGICEFRVIDCGQADSILIKTGEYVILVDAGESKGAQDIIKVLDNEGIKEIDLLIATHPHADHIGGMQTIVENYEIAEILMSPTGHTSKTYENLLIAMDTEGCPIYTAEPEDVYTYGNLELSVIGPCEEYDDDLNNSSIVILATFGETDLLLTGDAEMQAEKDFVQYLNDIDILKVGHHGSDTSTSDNLLDISTPEVALISCGEGNSYGHPSQETLDKLSERNIAVYRTDLSGDIVIRTDGIDYTIETDNDGEITISDSTNDEAETKTETQIREEESDEQTESTETIVFISKSGKKYHSTTQCSRLYTSKVINEITEKEAVTQGKEKCSNCW